MVNFNKVILMGNLVRDPELRYVPSGTPVVNLRMAVNRYYKTQTGEDKEETCFITVVVWGKQALPCSEHLTKGSALFVEGRLQSRSWETNDGQKRSVVEVIGSRVQFLGAKKKGEFEVVEEPVEQQAEANSSISGEDNPAEDGSITS